MMPVTIAQAIQNAQQHQSAGRLTEAEAIYRQILAQQPNNAQALYLFGMLTRQMGRLDAAIDLIRRAIAVVPNDYVYHNNLGTILSDMSRLDGAIDCYRTAIHLKPDLTQAHNNLGNALRALGQLDAAIASYRQALRFAPDLAEVHNNLGAVLLDQKQFEEAIATYRHAIRLKPDLAEAHSNLGNALYENGQFDEAVGSYRQAIQIKPDYAEAYFNLGNALNGRGRFDEAIASYRQAIGIQPNYASALTNLGNALSANGQYAEAIVCYQQALKIDPQDAEGRSNLGNALRDSGQLDDSIASYRDAIRIKPRLVEAHSNLLYTLHFHPDYDARALLEEHRRWNQQHAVPLKKFVQPHANVRDPDRRLRIGYVSPDFRDHVVGQNLLPLLREHDHKQFEIFCYANMVHADVFTEQIRPHADVWRNIAGLSDSHAADLIRRDQIDILVDLALHTAHNRLLIFALKPAPVQLTYLGYCSTTGLETMDYRLSDPYLDPSESDLSLYTETTICLPETYWCYNPRGPTPAPSPPPVETAQNITFGCLNNFAKVSPALGLWAEILQSVPRSRLILHAHAGPKLDVLREWFAGKGILPDRLEFPAGQPWAEYVRNYGRIDIALDPFPWGGGITTCDALWMGVPVVSLAGRTAVGRGGASILSNVGVPELIARTPAEYVQTAIRVASDLPRLAELRRALRPRMQESPLMNAPRFARNIEAAYRRIWREWCRSEAL